MGSLGRAGRGRQGPLEAARLATPDLGGGPSGPLVKMTPAVAAKVAVSVVLLAAGLHYLSTGRRDGDMGRIVTGAVLALASLLFFL